MVDVIKLAHVSGRSSGAAAVLLLMCSCATLKVPADPPEFKSEEMLHAGAPGIEMSVMPIRGRDSYWSLFDDNLPEAGIAAVWVTVRNTADAELDLSRVKWVLSRDGRDYPALNGDQVFKLYYQARHVRMYAAESDRRARLALERIRFQPGRVSPSANREGFVFFRIDPGASPDWSERGILIADDIRVGNNRMSMLQVHLSYAHP